MCSQTEILDTSYIRKTLAVSTNRVAVLTSRVTGHKLSGRTHTTEGRLRFASDILRDDFSLKHRQHHDKQLDR